MGYSDQIIILKNSLNGYGSEERKLSALYKTAIKNAENSTKAAIDKLEKDYYRSRNEAYADSAREERNLNNLLSARGLGFSGEAAQAKLNANVNLSGRLGDLARQKSEAEQEYTIELANKISALNMEEAEKLKELLDGKNKLNLDIAGMELQKETADADRNAEKENLQAKLEADKQQNDAKIQADKDMLDTKLNHEKDLETQKLEFSLQELNAKLQLEKDKLNAEKEMLDTKLRAEREALITRLEAEKDMLNAELLAKYYKDAAGSGGVGGGSGTAGTEDGKEKYTPDISPKDLAKQLTGGKKIADEESLYVVDKFILGLNTNYEIDEDYFNRLIFMLESYGYTKSSNTEMRTRVITHEAKAYDSKEEYNKLYNGYIAQNYTPADAKTMARKTIKEAQMNYILENCKYLTEFRLCCIELGISTSVYNDFLKRMGKA